MNYEDRRDLSLPEEVVGSDVLRRLRSADSDPLGCLNRLGDLHEIDAIGRKVIATFISSEGADGAPPTALDAEQDAAECGYAFGRLLLGLPVREDMTSARVSTEIDRIQLFGLIDLLDEGTPSFSAHLSAFLAQRARLVPGAEALWGALEEVMPLAWCTGLCAATVMADPT